MENFITMKKALKNIIKLLAGIFLFLLAITLVVAVIPIALVHQIYISLTREDRKARDILAGVKQFFISLAASVDQFGNTAYGALWNDLFLKIDPALSMHKHTHYDFGCKDETISEVLGINQRYFTDNLTRTARILIWILDTIDRDHCFKAMQSGKRDARDKVDFHDMHIAIK